MVDLDDTVNPEDVKAFRTAARNAAHRAEPLTHRRDFKMKPEVNGARNIVAQCTIEHNGVEVADSRELLYVDEDPGRTACGDAIADFRELIDQTYG